MMSVFSHFYRTTTFFALLFTTINYGPGYELESVFIIQPDEIKLTVSGEPGKLSLTVRAGNKVVPVKSVSELENGVYLIKTKEELDLTTRYEVTANHLTKEARVHWQLIDELYYYDGELGTRYSEDETLFRLWAPLATSVTVNLYAQGTDIHPYQQVELIKGSKGVWTAVVEGDLWVRFYNFTVTNYGVSKTILDPYAKSMAVTTEDHTATGKGAVVDPSLIGPELGFANIEGFEKREDAIIWEIHVRDFTSDPDITTKAQFGTYKAFIERLGYIQELGITHIQLLPVLNYRWGNELENGVRMLDYAVTSNYNWGYDPHNYFSPEGMYSEDPTDPELRIKELKELVKAIHDKGMGVTLDVVYNHTANLALFEDIVPGYYHFMDARGNPKSSYGGGRLGTTHRMVRKLVIDSMLFWTREYKVDGFRYDLMGDLDSETVQMAYDQVKEINPMVIKVGEGWRTYAGDDNEEVTPADQDWMGSTNSVASFSDEIRNELKSGFGSEGQPRFITGGPRNIRTIFNNVIAKPGNMTEDDPGDVLQYIAAHDNLTLHDVIAYSIKKDPAKHQKEIQQRIRLGNTILLTSQGMIFIHAGQEYGRTKQWKAEEAPESDYTYVEGFEHPYFIDNSYDATDIINNFDWDKVTQQGIHKETMEYTKGLISLRKSTDAFRLGTEEEIRQKVKLIQSKDIRDEDLVIGYQAESTQGTRYYVFVNADSVSRDIHLDTDLTNGVVLVDSDEAGTQKVQSVSGVELYPSYIRLDALTATVIKKD